VGGDGKIGVFVAGVPSSLAPRTHFSPEFSLPFPFPVYACYAGYVVQGGFNLCVCGLNPQV